MPHRRLSRACAAAAAVALLLAGCRSAAPDAGIPARLQAMFADLHERGLFDGAAVVAERDRILWEGGFGPANVERGVAFTPDTPADGGSLAKTFTALLLVMLESEGRLDLDDPAQRLLPELPYPEVTLRHLLSHSSGLPVGDYDYFDKLVPPGEVRTTEVLLRALATAKPPLAYAPGSRFEYSSFGFDLAALAAARAAGKPLADLMHERLFAPLGMSSAFLRPGRLGDFPGVRTLGYERAGDARKVSDVFDLEAFHGGSNVYVSARDLHRWNASFLTSPLLPRDALAHLLEPARIAGAPSGLTLGSWYRDGDASFWYSGHLQGFHSEVFRDTRRGWSVAYVSNNTLEPWLQHAIVRNATAILRGERPAPPQKPPFDAVAKEERPSLAGTWDLHPGELTLERGEEGRLSVLRDGVAYRMIPVRPDTFYVPGLDLILGFTKGAGGRFEKVYVSSNAGQWWGTYRYPSHSSSSLSVIFQ